MIDVLIAWAVFLGFIFAYTVLLANFLPEITRATTLFCDWFKGRFVWRKRSKRFILEEEVFSGESIANLLNEEAGRDSEK